MASRGLPLPLHDCRGSETMLRRQDRLPQMGSALAQRGSWLGAELREIGRRVWLYQTTCALLGRGALK